MIYTEPLNYANFRDTLVAHCEVAKIKGVKIVPDQVKVTFVTDLLTEERIEGIPIQCLNMPEGKVLRTRSQHLSHPAPRRLYRLCRLRGDTQAPHREVPHLHQGCPPRHLTSPLRGEYGRLSHRIHRAMKIGIAGGIGSGKSYVCQALRQRGYEVYDCDAAAKRLIRTSPDIRRELTALIGPDTYDAETGEFNKAAVARFLLASEANAQAIDAIVHPAVFRDFEASGLDWLESAIMFESGIYRLMDIVIAVVAPKELRIQRVMERDHISREKVLEWMSRQYPQREVIQRADFVLVNDGKANIEHQLNKIIEQCNKQF